MLVIVHNRYYGNQYTTYINTCEVMSTRHMTFYVFVTLSASTDKATFKRLTTEASILIFNIFNQNTEAKRLTKDKGAFVGTFLLISSIKL